MPQVKRRHVVGVSPLDERGHKGKPPLTGGVQLRGEISILRAPMDCYKFWRQFENLPRFLDHLEEVTVIDSRRSHWVITGPGDTYVEWDAETIEDVPGRLISWRSLPNAQIDNAGSVYFDEATGGGATNLKIPLTYNPPAGLLGDLFARLFGEAPSKQLDDDLVLFKRLMETGKTDV
jgi:uncharacterized membrane protein